MSEDRGAECAVETRFRFVVGVSLSREMMDCSASSDAERSPAAPGANPLLGGLPASSCELCISKVANLKFTCKAYPMNSFRPASTEKNAVTPKMPVNMKMAVFFPRSINSRLFMR